MRIQKVFDPILDLAASSREPKFFIVKSYHKYLMALMKDILCEQALLQIGFSLQRICSDLSILLLYSSRDFS